MDLMIYFDITQTVAFAAFLLLVGAFIRGKARVLEKYNIPTPVIGGLLFAFVNLGLQQAEIGLRFDMTLQSVFMTAFFTSIGMGASIKLLKEGGSKLIIFLAVASVLLVLQNLVSWGLSIITGINPLIGLLAGSITMSGGHGTGATFANYFAEAFSVYGAMEVAMAAATFGLVAGSLLGGPVARHIIMKKNLKPSSGIERDIDTARKDFETAEHQPIADGDILRSIFQIALCMGIGTVLYAYFFNVGVKVPTYLFALFVGIVVRNVAEYKGWYKVNVRLVEMMGATSLSLFLAMALMSMQLRQLAGLAIPMLVILTGQVVLIVLYVMFVTYYFCGRDYDAAVLVSGHCGFGLGATPNAIANMQAVSNKYGPAPRAFFLVSIVGAFFIDIVNAFVIQGFVSFM
ncbi:MAG: sodium/glutamate symporter [Synergistaceae bacterium]|nr:sodium/glutamate symporter [Synergistaceae bacterium]